MNANDYIFRQVYKAAKAKKASERASSSQCRTDGDE